jgi:hypothetical protein
VLVLVQVAVAVVLTAGASLLARSLQHLVAIDNGFAGDRLISVDLYLRGVFDGDSGKLFEELTAQAKTIPGVASAAVTGQLPTRVIGLRASVRRAGGAGAAQSATWRPVDPGYFETAGIPVVAGRPFASTDTARAPRGAIVNRAFQRTSSGEAVGEKITTSLGKEPLTIVGVAGDVTPAGEPDRPAVYVPIDQAPIGGGYLLIRTRSDPRTIIPVLIARLRGAAPALAMDRVRRVAESLEAGRAVTRFSTLLATAFAGLALLLSAIGVYGMVAGEVSVRWRELAVRLAVGASHGDVLWSVIRPCAAILGGAVAFGVLGMLSAGPALQSLLHGARRRLSVGFARPLGAVECWRPFWLRPACCARIRRRHCATNKQDSMDNMPGLYRSSQRQFFPVGSAAPVHDTRGSTSGSGATISQRAQ